MTLSKLSHYEMFEWWVAVLGGFDAEAFLATQVDLQDTQWDMFLALLGASAAELLLAGTIGSWRSCAPRCDHPRQRVVVPGAAEVSMQSGPVR